MSSRSIAAIMFRYFLKLLHLSVFVVSVMIATKMFMGQSFVRNETGVSKWPNKIKLGVRNFGCNIPSPNFNVTEGDLIKAWQLPVGSRLSPIMRETAHCKLAAEKFISQGGVFDSSKCYCTNYWPIVVLVSVLLCALFNLIRLTCCFWLDKKLETALDYLLLSLIPGVPYGLMYLSFFCYWKISNLDFSYWAYGDLYPSNYYLKSDDWDTIFTLIIVGCFIPIFEMCFCISMAFLKSLRSVFKKAKAWIKIKKQNAATVPTASEDNLSSIEEMFQAKAGNESSKKECLGHI